MKKRKSLLRSDSFQTLLTSLLCIILGVAIGYVVLLIINPAGAWKSMSALLKNFFHYPAGKLRMKYFGQTLVRTAPLLMCALSILFAYKVGMFNIGAAGQYVAGACVGLYAAIAWQLPWYLCLLLAIAAGAFLGAISGALRTYCNVNVVISGIMLKKTKMFSGDPAPFVMELPAYHWPTLKNVLRSMWERGWSFIKKAGTIILLSTIVVWFTSYFGFVDGHFGMLAEDQLDQSLLAKVGSAIAWIFVPLGWGNWQATVASITGLVAKENIVGTMGILYGAEGNVYATLAKAFTGITAYSFLVFNLLCAPCFAAIGAIKREMNSAKWTWFAIGYQCGFAYVISLMINQFGNLFTGNIHGAVDIVSLVFAFAFLALIIFMLVRPYKEATKLASDVKVTK